MTDAWITEEGDISPENESKYDDIEILEVVDSLPPDPNSLYTEIIQSLIEAQDEEADTGFKWRTLSTGGRQKNTVQSGLNAAARRFGVKVQTKTLDVDGKARVYVRLKGQSDTSEEATEE